MRMIAELAVRGNYKLTAEEGKNGKSIIIRLLERGDDLACSLVNPTNGVVEMHIAQQHFSSVFAEALMKKSLYHHQRNEDAQELMELYELFENFISNLKRFPNDVISLGSHRLEIKVKDFFSNFISAVFNARNEVGHTTVFDVLRHVHALDDVLLDTFKVNDETWRVYHRPHDDETTSHRALFTLYAVTDTYSEIPKGLDEKMNALTVKREVKMEFKKACSVKDREQLTQMIQSAYTVFLNQPA